MMKNNPERGKTSLFCAVEEVKGTEWMKCAKSVSESVRLYTERGRLCLKNCMKKSRELYIRVEMNITFICGSDRTGIKRE